MYLHGINQISSSATPSNSRAARQARKNVAGNVPRASLLVIEASVSFRPCRFSRFFEARIVFETGSAAMEHHNRPSPVRVHGFAQLARPRNHLSCDETQPLAELLDGRAP